MYRHMAFPSCCGAGIIDTISGLSHTDVTIAPPYGTIITTEQFKAALSKALQPTMGATLLITTSDQERLYGSVLLEMEFMPIIEHFHNDVHGSMLTLWARLGQPHKMGKMKFLKKDASVLEKLIEKYGAK